MTWTTITKPTLGEATKKTAFADAVVDNLADLNSRVSLVANAALQNGSFEYDANTDGVPDNWTITLYAGGSSAIETTDVAHGNSSYKFTSPGGGGNGGGYGTSDDYVPCSPQKYLFVDFLTKSSVAGIHNLVEVLWYDKAKSYLSVTAMYDEAVANPTAWGHYIIGKMPPATAVYCRVRLTGAKNDNATAGICYFDGVSIYDTGSSGETNVTISEETLVAGNDWTDKGSTTIHLPIFGNALSKATLTFIAQLKNDGDSTKYQRFRIGSLYSDEFGSTSASYANNRFSISYVGTGGAVTLTQQLKASGGAGYSYGKIDATSISISIVMQ